MRLKMAWELIQGAEDLNKRLLDDIISQNNKIHILEEQNKKLYKENIKLRMHLAIDNWEKDLNKNLLEELDNLNSE
jgi:hypothetical protein